MLLLFTEVSCTTFLFFIVTVVVATVPQAHDSFEVDLLITCQDFLSIALVFVIMIKNLFVLLLRLLITPLSSLAGLDCNRFDEQVEVAIIL